MRRAGPRAAGGAKRPIRAEKPTVDDVVNVQDAGKITVRPDVKTPPSLTWWKGNFRGEITKLL
jgi:hypothetical protein